jgi:aconitate hydratase
VLAKGFGRIHEQNLVNFGVLPLFFTELRDYAAVAAGDVLEIADVREAVRRGPELTVFNRTEGQRLTARHRSRRVRSRCSSPAGLSTG